jgi:hypothetical protein
MSDFRNAGILKDGRVLFNLAGNKYRLVVWINYPYRAHGPAGPSGGDPGHGPPRREADRLKPRPPVCLRP